MCVFYYIMKQSSHDGLISESDIAYYNLRYSYRVEYIRLSGTSSDALVSFVCEIEGLLDHLQFCRV